MLSGRDGLSVKERIHFPALRADVALHVSNLFPLARNFARWANDFAFGFFSIHCALLEGEGVRANLTAIPQKAFSARGPLTKKVTG